MGQVAQGQIGIFRGIEGARGWLAWSVFAAHLIVATPLSYLPGFARLIPLGNCAVLVFIIISGFVITHLLLSKGERFRVYILRRALRIYPAYLVGLALGISTVSLGPDLLTHFPMQPPSPIHQAAVREATVTSPPIQMLLHLLLLQGIVPSSILPGAQFGYLSAAWSLSLEWQFYWLAPLFVASLRKWPAATAALVAILMLAFQIGAFGRFVSPSLIFAAGWYFLIGIASRLHLERLPSFGRYPVALAAGIAPAAWLGWEVAPLVVWFALLAYIRSDSDTALLDGRIVRYFGARSYAVYIFHVPIIVLSAWFAWHVAALGTRPAILVTAGASALLTAAAAEIVYRFVERPAIRLGKRLHGAEGSGAQGW